MPAQLENWDQFMGRLRDGVADGLEDLCRQGVAEMHMLLSVEVDRDADGNVTQRSKPGEPPRLEFGQLQLHVDHEVTYGDDPEAEIFVDRPPTDQNSDPDAARILEEGGIGNWGPIAARPYVAPTREFIEGIAPEVISRAIAANLPK